VGASKGSGKNVKGNHNEWKTIRELEKRVKKTGRGRVPRIGEYEPGGEKKRHAENLQEISVCKIQSLRAGKHNLSSGKKEVNRERRRKRRWGSQKQKKERTGWRAKRVNMGGKAKQAAEGRKTLKERDSARELSLKVKTMF